MWIRINYISNSGSGPASCSNGFTLMQKCKVAEFIVPDWGDKVNYAMGLSYRPSKLYIGWHGGPGRQPYAGVDYVPQ
jgi:hypothetical protein